MSIVSRLEGGSNMTDRELVARILAGDEQAFAELYMTNRKKLIKACATFLRNQDEVLDIVQDTFIKAQRYLPNFQFKCSLSTWLNHIAVNLCRDYLEKSKRAVPTDDAFFRYVVDTPQLHSSYEVEHLEMLREEIAKTQDPFLHAFYILHKKYQQTADRLGVPVGTVTSHLYRSRRMLIARIRQVLLLEENDGRGTSCAHA
jgi:RNA polymerase sigma-70 factor (ECF subfamily)